jgi:hypothetical protein
MIQQAASNPEQTHYRTGGGGDLFPQSADGGRDGGGSGLPSCVSIVAQAGRSSSIFTNCGSAERSRCARMGAYPQPEEEAMTPKHALPIASILAFAALLALAGAVLSQGTPAAGALDGKTFAGSMGEKGKTKGDTDTFVFAKGTFDSLACHKFGFAGAPYTATENNGRVHFEATTTSTKEGTMAWKGSSQNDSIAGKAVWSKPGQAPVEYWFRGTLKR